MCGLVQPDAAAAGQRDRSGDSPIRRLHLGALHILRFQRCDKGIKIVALRVQHGAWQLLPGMLLGELAVQGVNRGFRGGHAEDQPAAPNVDGAEFKNIAKKGSVRLGISAVKQEMSADNHAAEYIRIDAERLTYLAVALKIEDWT